MSIVKIIKSLNISNINTTNLYSSCYRNLSVSSNFRCAVITDETEVDPNVAELPKINPEKDRSRVIPVETSIKYLTSEAYQQTYGNQKVWEQYRRNHKGHFAPRKTRKTCIRQDIITTGNPCPICRDEYLVVDHRNLDLIKQFISPQSGKVLSYTKTGLCQKKHLELLVSVERAMDYGSLTFDVQFREYDYSEYYDKDQAKNLN